MFRSIYLVARRDYLGYVTAWGFWLGLLITPVLLGVGMMVPALAASSVPVRYFTVVDAQGDFHAALVQEMADRRERIARNVVDGAGMLLGDDADRGAALERFDAAIEAGESPAAAMEIAAPHLPDLQLPEQDFVLVDPPAQTLDDLRPYLVGERFLETESGPRPLFAALLVSEEGVEYWSENVTVDGIKSLARRAASDMARNEVFGAAGVSIGILDEIEAATPGLVEKRLREEAGSDSEVTLADRAPFIVSIAMSFFLWTLIFSVVNYLLMGTIEERSNKIFDTLLTSVKLPHMLAGKLIAVLAVSLTLMSVWTLGGMGVTALGISAMPGELRELVGAMAAAALDPGILIPALISFLLGYLMYGSIFLALGSLCDTIQEAQTLMTPLLILLMVPLFVAIVAMTDPESPVLSVLSWVPLFTPFLMILRMPTEPPLWEVLAQLGLMVAFTVAILWLAARIYRAGAVHGAGVNDAMGYLKRTVSFGRA
ncbi:MAG: ABC transporter permease [Hyphomonadaceae bacterium]|nr:ABC transporter permease [Hyphomonadaceae bacterium]